MNDHTIPESPRIFNLDLETQLAELYILTELLAVVVEMIDGPSPAKERIRSDTASWLIYEAAERAKKAHEIYHEEVGKANE